MSEDIGIEAEQARKELRLTMAALKEFEEEAIAKIASPDSDEKARLDAAMTISVVRRLPSKLQSHIDSEKIANHNPYEE